MIYYIVFGVIFCFCLFISIFMHFKLSRFYDIKTDISGFESAKKFLSDTEYKDIYIVTTKSNICNYYDVTNRAIKFSNDTFNGEDMVNVCLAVLVSSDVCMGNFVSNFRNKFFKYFVYFVKLCYLFIILSFLISEYQFCYACIVLYVIMFVFSFIYFVLISSNINNIVNKCSKLGIKIDNKVINILKYMEFSLYVDIFFRG